MTDEDVKAELERLRSENAALKKGAATVEDEGVSALSRPNRNDDAARK